MTEQTDFTTRTNLGTATRAAGVVLAVLMTPLLAACGADPLGGGGAGDKDSDVSLTGEAEITASFEISGDVSVNGEITDNVPANKDGSFPGSCEEYAKGFKLEDGRVVLDLPRFLGSEVDGHSLMLDGRISEYAGPGTYPLEKLSGSGNPIGFSIDSHALVAEETATVTVTVNADGSGSFTFDKLTETSTGITNPQSITGKMTWTCQNA